MNTITKLITALIITASTANAGMFDQPIIYGDYNTPTPVKAKPVVKHIVTECKVVAQYGKKAKYGQFDIDFKQIDGVAQGAVVTLNGNTFNFTPSGLSVDGDYGLSSATRDGHKIYYITVANTNMKEWVAGTLCSTKIK